MLKAIGECAVVYGRVMSVSEIALCADVWLSDLEFELRRLTDEEVVKVIEIAAREHRRESQTFPKVNEMRDRIYNARRQLKNEVRALDR